MLRQFFQQLVWRWNEWRNGQVEALDGQSLITRMAALVDDDAQ